MLACVANDYAAPLWVLWIVIQNNSIDNKAEAKHSCLAGCLFVSKMYYPQYKIITINHSFMHIHRSLHPAYMYETHKSCIITENQLDQLQIMITSGPYTLVHKKIINDKVADDISLIRQILKWWKFKPTIKRMNKILHDQSLSLTQVLSCGA